MTEGEYWGAVEALGLKQTKIPTVFYCVRDGHHYNVRNPANMSDEARAEFIRELRRIIEGT